MTDSAVLDRGDPIAELALMREALGETPLRRLSVEPLGAGAVAGFAVGEAPDERLHYLDSSALPVQKETGLALRADDGTTQARIWVHPADPHLPALAAAAFDHSLEVLLGRLAIATAGDAEMIGYRPGRRAVLRVPTTTGTTWVKVVRPSRVDRIVRAHEACARAGLPVPVLRGWSSEGLIVLDSAEGTPASDVVWTPARLLDETQALRERIARIAWAEPARPVAARLAWYAGRFRDASRAHALAARIGAAVEALVPSPPLTIHGDLHYGQLFLTDDAISGFIDVDTLGRGAAAEDSAAFLAHAVASARMTPSEHASRVWALADEALLRWEHDPATRPFTAVHLLGHAVAADVAGDGAGCAAFLDIAERILKGATASPEPG